MSLATTEVTTLSSFFRDPAGLALDGAGALYVTDLLDVAIRKIDLSTNVVSTLAGSLGSAGSVDGIGDAARFPAPYGIVYDGAGNLLVSDYNNNIIRRVAISTATVTTMAGSAGLQGSADGTGSAARFNAPAGLSLDGGNLFISDFMDRTIRKLVLSTAEVTTLAGAPPVNGSADGSGAAARFDNPAGMAVNAAGDLFIADSGNETIRRIAAGGDVVSTLAGSPGITGSMDAVGPAAVFFAPFGVACDDSGNLFVADVGNETIRAIVIATASVTTLAGTAGYGGRADGVGKLAGFGNPAALAWGTGGILVVSDMANNEIRQIAIASATVSTLAGGPPSPNEPASGSSDGVGSAARFYHPNGIALDGAGNAYVADQVNHTIRKVVIASGTVTTIAGLARPERRHGRHRQRRALQLPGGSRLRRQGQPLRRRGQEPQRAQDCARQRRGHHLRRLADRRCDRGPLARRAQHAFGARRGRGRRALHLRRERGPGRQVGPVASRSSCEAGLGDAMSSRWKSA